MPEGALVRLGTTRLRHPEGVSDLAFSPDGTSIVSAGHDGTVRLWETKTGKLLKVMGQHQGGGARCAAFVKGGKELISVGGDNIVCRWDVASGKELARFSIDPGQAIKVGVTPDGKYVGGVALFGREVYLWDVASGKELKRFPGKGKESRAFGFSPNSKLLACAEEDHQIVLMDVVSGEEIDYLKGHEGAVFCLAFSADGKYMVSLSADWTMRLWVPGADKQELCRFELPQVGFPAVAISPDGQTIVTGEQSGPVRIWSAKEGKEICQIEDAAHKGTTTVAISADGLHMASGNHVTSSIRVRSVETGKEVVHYPGHDSRVTSLAVAPDGKAIASASWDHTIRLRELATGKELGRFEGEVLNPVPGGLFFSDSGTLVAVDNQGVAHFWDVATKKRIRQMTVSPKAGVPCGAMSPDGKMIAVASFPKSVFLWDVQTGAELHHWDQHPGGVTALTFSPDGRLLACASRGESVTIRTENKPRRVSVPEAIHLWDVGTGESRGQLKGREGGAWALSISPDGRFLVAGGQQSSTIDLWELQTQQLRSAFSLPDGIPTSLAFCPDGRHFAVASTTRLVRVYDLYRPFGIWSPGGTQGTVAALGYTPDGRVFAAGCADGSITCWSTRMIVDGATQKHTELTESKPERYWDLLAASEPHQVHQVVSELVRHPEVGLRLLKQHLEPVARDPCGERQIERWIAQLDSDEFTKRTQATEELRKLKLTAAPALRKAMMLSPSAEVKARARKLFNELEAMPTDPDQSRNDRAVEILERIGTGGAKELLEALAQGAPGMSLTEAARASLDRLNRRGCTK